MLLNKQAKTSNYASVKSLTSIFGRPNYPVRLMTALNEIAEGRGIELIRENGADRARYEFLRIGDDQCPTLFRDCRTGRKFVSCIASVAEKMKRKPYFFETKSLS